jgi:hypothetical protein
MSQHPAVATAAVVALTFALAPAPAASAAELAGVSMPDRSEAGGQSLVLNGLGLREKFFVDVYVAGLYLPSKQTSERAVVGSDTPRHLVMHFVHDVTKKQICDAWMESLEANRPDASAALKKDFETLCGMMADVEDGEEMAFTYVPGTGTTVSVKGQEQGTIEGKEFADALYASWIGEHPATGKLKKGLLGG